MARNEKEKELLEKFKNILIGKYHLQENDIVLSPQNKRKEMDFVIKNIVTKTAVCLEAKVFEDSRSNSDSFWIIFGKILKGRKLTDNTLKKNFDFFEYGFVFRDEDKIKIKEYIKCIYKEDWVIFCESFEVKRIYLVADDSFSVYSAISFYEFIIKE